MTNKGMQSLLGTTVICSKFIPNYSVRVQALYSMTTMNYDWKSCWNPTEIAAFVDLKQAILDCCALYYPDAFKFLVLETDASTTGWGYVLYQFDTKDYIIEPIMYGGAKFLNLQLAGQLSNQNVTASMVVLKQLSHTFLQDHSFCTTTIKTSKPSLSPQFP